MKILWVLTIFVVAVSAAPAPEEERNNGENGWYVPQSDGSLAWVTIQEGEKMLAQLEAQDEIQGRIFPVPVSFYLYTNKNPSKAQKITQSTKSIVNSNFNADNPTRFVIHGWIQGKGANLNDQIRSAWLARGKYNVIVVDWARARGEYATAVVAVPKVGKKMADMINYLVENYGMLLNTTEVIGHSLGAHVAGYTGKNIKNGKLKAIIGLDTALPLYSYKKANKRLDANDAHYVETIHTNGGQLGFLKPIGKADFYPNGGKSQPGCGWDLTGACDHARSCTYYAEAIASNSFPSTRCTDYKAAVKDQCSASYSYVKMGAANNAFEATGEFYVPVHKSAPFGFGSS